MMIYQLSILFCLLVFFVIVLLNLKDFKKLPSRATSVSPLVSVLVPARNEDNTIARCIESLLIQDYGNFEIIVLNDGSTDRTAEVLQSIVSSVQGAALRVIDGTTLPDGWHGKAWACQQLGAEARGELLLFTDADTVHAPDSVRRAVAALDESRADMLSLTPYQETKSFWERLIIPVMYVIVFCYLPLRMVREHASEAFCFANGQFIMMQRKMYDLINGHSAVRRNIVEDVWLCKAVKRAGGSVAVYNGTDTVRCRMYRTLSEIWQGFSKNLFAGLGYNTIGLFSLIVMTALFYIVPYIFVFRALLLQDYSFFVFWLPCLQIALAMLMRLFIAVRFRQPLSGALLHGLSQLMLIALAANSFYLVRFGGGARWKGRQYDFSDHQS
ncbi:glycosyl transferase family 2 [Prosthecochloris aestuarii DSM 271]|uniref:Glycosyl transferase family 2 n=1 Tax=Prosthecochloris aestuarii (strain DSM 271 / SK 413) TaxID=290512 RepID=B4S560_PROA2|nr:glycosyltransferase [Prosthecochloris aestuarii]ACF47006.1 glycosyl transferase family 2 [Prosthecochloris aestuarii DSM 271]